MTYSPSRWTDSQLGELLRSCGVSRYGIVRIEAVEPEACAAYRLWIDEGANADMEYLERYSNVRANPGLLLPGARSMICCAFPYWHPQSANAQGIASYALGTDYHETVRRRLTEVAAALAAETPCECRVCVDTAPLRERYWAQRAGLGTIGRSGHLIIPGAGSYFFLGEILTTLELPVTAAETHHSACDGCGRCVRACPTGALRGDGTVDARRCLSYLTIEHRGEFPDGTDLHGCLYGCDICGRVCPCNADPEPTALPEFTPRPEVLALDAAGAAVLTQERFSAIFTHSAVKRAKLAGLRRNALALLSDRPRTADKIGGLPKNH